ncbi:Scr1 family TA system antitoxin-like transcriptional regulator [Micromonospora sp. WMMD734]|uniref:Scr1 family TA system antitoxin-like transcriptional regulator n=1 Tax=Micromonospora sp. WMMD734 TaxID=3404129 RepID=UPI003B961C84
MNEVLRVAMAERGETVESLAHRVGVDPKTAGRWLSAGRVPHPRTRVAVAGILGREPAELWPEPYRRRDLPWFRPWVELEQDAVSIRSYQSLLVPGLLQTEEYARAVLGTGCLLPPDEVAQLVSGRLKRQVLLDRDPPAQVVFMIDELVLHRMVGSRVIMARQVAHLVAVAGAGARAATSDPARRTLAHRSGRAVHAGAAARRSRGGLSGQSAPWRGGD